MAVPEGTLPPSPAALAGPVIGWFHEGLRSRLFLSAVRPGFAGLARRSPHSSIPAGPSHALRRFTRDND